MTFWWSLVEITPLQADNEKRGPWIATSGHPDDWTTDKVPP